MDKKTLVLFGTVLTLILGIVGSLIAWFCGGDKLEGPAREAIRKMFNFEITFLIASVILMWIPILGQLAILALWVANIVFAIKSFNAANKEEDVNVLGFEFIK